MASDARRRSDPPPSSASSCPACGKTVDMLRAGHVAILDGAFRYFCDAACKSAYVDVSSKRAALDAMTADPPPVAPSGVRSDRSERVELAASSGVRLPRREETPRFPNVVLRDREEVREEEREEERAREEERERAEEREDDATRADADADADAADETSAELDDENESPRTLRSPASSGRGAKVAARDAVSASKGGATVVALAPYVAIAAGVLASVVSLAGEAAARARLPLALAAAIVVVARGLFQRREPSDPSPLVVVAPIVVAAAAAAVAAVSHAPRADAHATFVGLAAAAALVVEQLFARTRRDIVDARAKVASDLTVRARVVASETMNEVDASEVKPGEQVVVEAGEMVPVDGIVAAGGAEVEPWLDSAVVLEKREGDAVVAGAVVVSGRLRVTTTFAGADRAWLRLAAPPSSERASPRIEVAAPLVEFARRGVERGAPIAALLVAGATYAGNGGIFDVIISACAGAYGLAAASAVGAAALAHARGHAAAQRRGIVYKDAIAFDAAARADIAVVCSRGTILLGEPEIVAVEPISGAGQAKGDAKAAETQRVLSLAAGAELASSHPFAAAVLRAARARNVQAENVRSALVHSGLGVTALAPNGDKLIVGSRAFLLQEKVSVAIADARVSALEAEGRSVLLVALAGRLVGLLALQDGLRPGARAAVQRMHDARIEPVLLSGEARDTCETIARSLDIDHVRPEILPGDRGAEVRALADGGHVVAAVGHASTDDGALGAADVSVAMGAAGAAPGEWSVALASDDVRDAALALTVPRASRERAKTAALVGVASQVTASLGIAFGVAPPAIAPIVALAAAGFVISAVRDTADARGAS